MPVERMAWWRDRGGERRMTRQWHAGARTIGGDCQLSSVDPIGLPPKALPWMYSVFSGTLDEVYDLGLAVGTPPVAVEIP